MATLTTIISSPVAFSSAEATDANTVVVTFSAGVSSVAESADDWSFDIDGVAATITGVVVSGSTATLTVSDTMTAEDSPDSVAYTRGDLVDASGNLVKSFGGQSITNSIPAADVTPPTLGSAATTSTTTFTATASETITSADFTATAPWTVEIDGTPVTLASVSHSSGVLTFTISGDTFADGDTLTYSYDSGTGDIEDSAGNALASFTDAAITNSIGGAAITVTKHYDGSTVPAVVALELSMSGFSLPDKELIYDIDWGDTSDLGNVAANTIAVHGNTACRGSIQDKAAHMYEDTSEHTVSISVSDGVNTDTQNVTFQLVARSVPVSNTIYVDPAGTIDVQHGWAPSGGNYATTAPEALTKYNALSGDTVIVLKDDATFGNFGGTFEGSRNLWIERSGDGTNQPLITMTGGGRGIATNLAEGYRTVVDGIEISGGWDPDTETGGESNGVRTLEGGTQDLLIKDCDIHNCYINVYLDADAGDSLSAIVRTRMDNSGNFGVLNANPWRFVVIGCAAISSPTAWAGGRGKGSTYNFHGSCIRVSAPRNVSTGWCIYDLNDTMNNITWTGDVTADFVRSQPGWRWNFAGVKDAVLRSARNYHEGTTHTNISNEGGGEGGNASRTNSWVHGCRSVQSAQATKGSAFNINGSNLWLTSCTIIQPDVTTNPDGGETGYFNQFNLFAGTLNDPDAAAAPIRLLNNTVIYVSTAASQPGNLNFHARIRGYTDSGGPNGDWTDFEHNNNIIYSKSSTWTSEMSGFNITEETYTSLGIDAYYESYQDFVRQTPDTTKDIPASTVIGAIPGSGSSLLTLDSGARALMDETGATHNARGAIKVAA